MISRNDLDKLLDKEKPEQLEVTKIITLVFSFTFIITTSRFHQANAFVFFSKQVTDTDEAMASAVDIGESDVSCIPNLLIFHKAPI